MALSQMYPSIFGLKNKKTLSKIKVGPKGLEKEYKEGMAPPSLLQQTGQAALTDFQAAQKAEKERVAQVNPLLGKASNIIGNYGDEVDSIAQGVEGALNINQKSGDVATFDKQAGETLSKYDEQASEAQAIAAASEQKVEGYAKQAVQRADAAAAQAFESARQLESKGLETLQGLTVGALTRGREALRAVNTGINPDGSLMTPEQQAASRQQVTASINRDASAVYAEAKTQIDQAVAAMQQGAATLTAQAGQTALGAGQAVGQAGQFRAGLTQQGAEGRSSLAGGLASQRYAITSQEAQSMNAVAADLAKMKAATVSALQMDALQLEAQGYMELAQLKSAIGVENPVSLFGAMAQIFAISTAPGASNAPGITAGS